ncbi:MAG: hypothetical protein DU429_01155 [Candidatus Tokpelaia sp.]|nr:MAG: hypothetical protein DU430_02785 [Candidatus Tokpelaia sp.]KAA6207678.1 MAG: hypothetical protein DU429_01155 [Candidatus Tokpelaia sp.]
MVAGLRALSWTTDGLNSNWQKIKKHLESGGKIGKKLTLKGLRHTGASILAEMGYDNRIIADMPGQRTIAMAQHYSRRANRSKNCRAW